MGAKVFDDFPQETTKTVNTLNPAVKTLVSLFVGIRIEKKARFPLLRDVIEKLPEPENIRHLLLSGCGRKMNFL